jgi:ribosome maturation factor RimP
MGAPRPFRVKGLQMATVHDKEKTLQREIGSRVESALPDVEVLAVELSGPERFTVFIDRVGGGVDHALCERVTNELREYLRDYTVDVSSPGLERPLRKPEHFRSVVGRRVALRTESRKRIRGEVVDAGDASVTVRTDTESVEVPYREILRGNLIATPEAGTA